MKRDKTISLILKTITAFVLIVSIYAFGYHGGSTANANLNSTLTPTQAKELLQNYKEATPPISGVVEGIYIDKTMLEDLNATLNEKRNADGVRFYFGKAADGSVANFIVAVTKAADDTTFILKSAGIASSCPNVCDSKSAIRN